MATQKGVWNIQQVRDKQLQDLWDYTAPVVLWGAGVSSPGAYLQTNYPGTISNYSSPVQLPGVPGANWALGSHVDQSMAGGAGWMGIKTDGTLWGWGLNPNGRLGNHPDYSAQPSNNGWSSPVQVGSGTDWKSVNHWEGGNGGIKTDGTLWLWGKNLVGGLGQSQSYSPSVRGYSSPVQVPGTTWDTCGNNGSGTMSRKTDGTLWAWGSNSYGELGQNQPHNSHRSSPVQIPGTTWGRSNSACASNITAIKTDGTLWAWGVNWRGQVDGVQGTTTYYSSPVQIPGTTWEKVTSAQNGWMAIKTDGTLWGVGSDYYGELGQNTNGIYRSSPVQIPGTNWNSIKCIGAKVVGTKTDGTAWGWGENSNYGQIGVNDRADRSSPVQLPGTWNMAYVGYYNTFYLAQQ